MTEIRNVAVIGAGVMGAGIAAQMANAGLSVLLLDIVPPDATDRSVIARSAIDRMKKTEPAPFMSARAAKLITPGNIEDDLDKLSGCDWIVEAVLERLDIKQDLYRKVEAVRPDHSVVSSNTSTIPLAALTEGLPERFQKDFMITHFFNPPRYMRLLELVVGPKTDATKARTIARVADIALGKGVVDCKDRPGFIANRLGAYWMQVGVVEAFNLNIDVETADALMSRPIGVPKTGLFGLLDLVGLDLIPSINTSLSAALDKSDPFQAYNQTIPLIEKLISEGYTGRKGKGGFYRVEKGAGGKRSKTVLDLISGEWKPASKANVAAVKSAGRDLRKLLDHDSDAARYARRVMTRTLAYAAFLVGDAADDPAAIDEAMRLGYAWKEGPFELIDKVGSEWLAAALEAQGDEIPAYLANLRGQTVYRVESGKRQVFQQDGTYRDLIRPEGVVLLSDIKLATKPVFKCSGASLWDVGDGVACFEVTSKMGTMDPEVLGALSRTLDIVAKDFKALVIHHEGNIFSAGANLALMLFAANVAAFDQIASLIRQGQDVFQAMRGAPFPVVAAPTGMALGGGCEILLHCDAVQAHAETYMGLVEVGVGVIPGWGGCAEMLYRWQNLGGLPKGPMPAIGRVFEILSTATVSKSAANAKELLFLRESDDITMNRDRLLADAKAKALSLVDGYKPPEPRVYTLPGRSGAAALDLAVKAVQGQGKATAYDGVVSGILAEILTGGDADVTDALTAQDILDLERQAFIKLVKKPGTLARIEHMLKTGKPLRN